MDVSQPDLGRVSTGIKAFDQILYGGLPRGEMYVVDGAPGTGKTILALHFLQAGVQAQEKSLCIALSQRVNSIQRTGASVGIDTTGILFRELTSAQALQSVTSQQTVFDPSDLELQDTMTALTAMVEEMQPQRVVFDSISYLRMLANDALTYRRQLLILRDYMTNRGITVLLTDTQELAPGDNELVSTAHGVFSLARDITKYGRDYRYLNIVKIRGSDYQQGTHDVEISSQGMQIYPIYNSQSLVKQSPHFQIKSGIPELDNLVGGGLQSGTSCLLIGPSGTGKSSIATLFARHWVQMGGKTSIFLFDELASTFLQRADGLGLSLSAEENSDRLHIHEISLSNITPGKFARLVEAEVVDWGAQVVMIDSLTGYVSSMPSSPDLITQMHEMLTTLNRQNVLSIIVVAQHGVLGTALEDGIDISYLADTVLLLRHFEARGALHRAIGVYKKRYGSHENGIRQVLLKSGGIEIGPLLEQFIGILSGIPQYTGEEQELMNSHEPGS